MIEQVSPKRQAIGEIQFRSVPFEEHYSQFFDWRMVCTLVPLQQSAVYSLRALWGLHPPPNFSQGRRSDVHSSRRHSLCSPVPTIPFPLFRYLLTDYFYGACLIG